MRASIFIYESMDIEGGIQSIVYRELDRAREQGRIALVVSRPLKSEQRGHSDCWLEWDATPAALASEIANRISGTGWVVDVIALSPEAIAVAQLLQGSLLKEDKIRRVRACVTVLHPRDFMRETEARHVHVLHRLAARALGLRNIIFMNKECRATHDKVFFGKLSANPIVPVPIDGRQARWDSGSQPAPLRIVAVGRIVQFKAYNFALPDILVRLAGKGLEVTCDIFGYGRDEQLLLSAIRDAGADHVVRFRGPIPLGDFDDTVYSYGLFIGMGTAAIQAAQLGVPTIVAISDDGFGAHGFFHQVPFGNVGEQDSGVPRQELALLIEDFLQADESERERISVLGAAHADRYVAPDYIDQLMAHVVERVGVLRHIATCYCRFYVWMAKDNWMRRSVRFLKGLAGRGRIS